VIVGAHALLYSRDPDADRDFFKDVLRLPSADVGGGWLLFGLPPSELAVHPGEKNDQHEIYLMCDDVTAFVAEMARHNIGCSPAKDQGWGIVTQVQLPGGGKLGVYQPRHARPKSGAAARSTRGTTKREAAKRRPAKPKLAKPKQRARRAWRQAGVGARQPIGSTSSR
jgi:hypothetical protein